MEMRVVLAYDTMTRWLLAGQWILSTASSTRDCLQEVLQAIGAGLVWEPPSLAVADVGSKSEGTALSDGRRFVALPPLAKRPHAPLSG